MSNSTGFMSISSFEAVYRDSQGEQIILCEIRLDSLGKGVLSTQISGSHTFTSSVHALVLRDPNCVSLRIDHKIRVWQAGQSHPAMLSEELIRVVQDHQPQVHVRLSLTVGDTVYSTEECADWLAAMAELPAVIARHGQQWRLQICHTCNYGFPAFRDRPGDDRDRLRCFRDAPASSFREARAKQASPTAFDAGHYFVNAFHSCVRWQPSRPLRQTALTALVNKVKKHGILYGSAMLFPLRTALTLIDELANAEIEMWGVTIWESVRLLDGSTGIAQDQQYDFSVTEEMLYGDNAPQVTASAIKAYMAQLPPDTEYVSIDLNSDLSWNT